MVAILLSSLATFKDYLMSVLGASEAKETRGYKIKLAAGIIFFNDYCSLQRCLNSINDGVDIIFAIDGKFPTFPSSSDLSTDGSRKLVRSYPKCVLIDFPKPEFEKRTKYLEYSALHSVDVLLIIDSDEFVLDNADWKMFRYNLRRVVFDRDRCASNVYAIQLQSVDKSYGFLACPRLWYKPAEMEYYGGRHYFFRNKDPAKINVPHQGDHSLNIIEGIKIGHDHSLRDGSHLKSRLIYQIWLESYEKTLSL